MEPGTRAVLPFHPEMIVPAQYCSHITKLLRINIIRRLSISSPASSPRSDINGYFLVAYFHNAISKSISRPLNSSINIIDKPSKILKTNILKLDQPALWSRAIGHQASATRFLRSSAQHHFARILNFGPFIVVCFDVFPCTNYTIAQKSI